MFVLYIYMYDVPIRFHIEKKNVFKLLKFPSRTDFIIN